MGGRKRKGGKEERKERKEKKKKLQITRNKENI
jgi:hypothetical protein